MTIQKLPDDYFSSLKDEKTAPWDRSRQAIYDAISRSAAPVEECILPDQAQLQDKRLTDWAPGAADAVLRSTADQDADQPMVIFALLLSLLEERSASALRALYDAMAVLKARKSVKSFCGNLENLSEAHATSALQLFRWLARNAPDREVVKIALASIGLLGNEDDEALLSTLGQHNEFTHLAGKALFHTAADPEESVWTLAKRVNGWGRIKTVERLRRTQRQDIQNWLVRDGYKNTIMYQYLTGIAVVTGNLAAQLQVTSPDDALLDGCADILSALVQGGPCRDISHYPQAVGIYNSFIAHSQLAELSIKRLHAIASVTLFLMAEPTPRHPAPQHWSDDQIKHAVLQGQKILKKPAHIAMLKNALQTGEPLEAWHAHRISKTLKLDLWDITFQRALSGDDIQWFVLLDTRDPHRMGQIVDFVQRTLPLETLAMGPTMKLIAPHKDRHHQIIGHVAQGLREFPGLGWPIINAALQSPFTRNRSMALIALEDWGPDHWPKDIRATFKKRLADEPDPTIKERITALIEHTA